MKLISRGDYMGKKIYIVDDDPDMVKVMALRLKSAGFEVESFTTSRQAVEKIRQSVPDLILLDILMPDMDGYQTAGEIDKIANAKTVPIIFLTGKLDLDQSKVPKRDKIAFFIKPCEFNELLAKINEML